MTNDEYEEWLLFEISFAQDNIDKSKQDGTELWKAYVGQKKAFEEAYNMFTEDNNKIVS